ncbi:MAG: phosphotransferase family protein [Nakamurella sp.]
MRNSGLDLCSLAAHLAVRRPDLAQGELTATLFAGGRSNLTYALAVGNRRFVLRRPPLSHVQASAHDMSREYRVITALYPTDVPVPATELFCDDPEVIGAPFYLMELVPGRALRRRADVVALGPDTLHRLIFALVDTLVVLHTVDPVTVGLADLGKVAGFNARQLRTWRRQLDGLRSRELPGIDELADDLAQQIPETGNGGLVHGDYRLDNVLIDGAPGNEHITAVLDWEMSTLGDPLSDLALLLLYADQTMLAGNGPDEPSTPISSVPGYPAGEDIVARYAERSGRDVSNLQWYSAFAAFKLAVVLEGVHYRHQHGATLGPGFNGIAEMVQPLIVQGRRLFGSTTQPSTNREQ